MGDTVSDWELQRQVLAELEWTPDVCSTHIGVSVRDGSVLLSGEVSSFPERRLAERAALRVHGVNVLADEITVSTAFSELTDLDIARSAQASLARHDRVPGEGVHLTVSTGNLTLTGSVRWRYESDAADLAVRYLKGVTSVTNHIVIRDPATAAEIHSLIDAALSGSSTYDRDQLTVSIDAGAVVLEGSVKTWGERRQADTAAWSAANVISVRNRLLVQL